MGLLSFSPQAESAPEIYTALSGMASCAPLIPKMKYFMGHKHCNMVTSPNLGFMVGAMGMSDASSCGGEIGIPVVDTTFGDFRVYYFSIAKVCMCVCMYVCMYVCMCTGEWSHMTCYST